MQMGRSYMLIYIIIDRSASKFECGTRGFISFVFRLYGLLQETNKVFFLAFIDMIVLTRLYFFFIPRFVSVNVLLEFVVLENLWPLQMFFFYLECSVCVCVCVCAYVH